MIDVDLKIYFSFRNRLDNEGKVTVEVPDSATVGEVLDEFTDKFPDFEDEIFEEPGEIRRFIQIRLNQKSITGIDGLHTKLKEGDEVQILPKLGGG
ncbi:MAG: ubiquitin-like small modifier protein 1 [Candidatus Bipolaricaulia bacterium]